MTKIVETSAALAAIRKSLRYRAGAVLSGGILGEEFAPVLARVARDLVEDLEMYAERHKRTLNGEIISRLPPMARLKWRVAQHESRHLTRVLLLAQSWADLPTVQGFGARDEIARFRSEPLEEGRELEGPVIALGRWGARRLGDPRPGEVVTNDSMASALMTTFRPESAGRANVKYELHLGDVVVHAHVRGGAVSVGTGPIEKPDLVVHAGPQLRQVMARELSPEDALKKKIVRVDGDPKLFKRFTEFFRI